MQQLDVSFLEMPYNGENGSMSMYIFLPILTDIDRFLGKLTLEMLDAVFDGKMYKRLVNFEFPKISFEQKIDLKPVNIYISKCLKTYCEFNPYFFVF